MVKKFTFNFKKNIPISILLLVEIIYFGRNYITEIKKNKEVIKNIKGDWGMIIIPKKREK